MISVAAAAAVLAVWAAVPGAERTSDPRFLAGLRQRRLFELADRYCTGRLADPQLSDPRRAELVIELSLTLAEWAVNSAPDEREPRWQRAVGVTEDFAGQYPESPQLPLVRLQGALALLARGELARQEAQVTGSAPALLEEALASLKDAIRLLEKLDRQVADELRERSLPGRQQAGKATPDPLTVHQLTSLKANIEYQLARAYRNQGQCYAADSPDRANSLTLAVKTCEALAGLDTLHPLAWPARLDEIVCWRLLADYPTAQRKLDALVAQKPPPAIALRAQAERLRLALATGRLPEAIRVLSEPRQSDGVTSADLDYARLETCLAAWRAATQSNDDQQAAQWQAKANEIVALIQRAHGPYWTRRAQMLLASYVRQVPGGDLAMMIQTAENAYHSGQYDEALVAYDRAVALAQGQGDLDQAFELGYIAATIEHQRGRDEEALSRYRRLAPGTSNHPKAPEAHRLALYHAGQLARGQPSGSLDQYIAIAEEHLQTWPRASTADEVRWCLGSSRRYRGEWQQAVAQFQAISPGHAKHGEAIEALEGCYEAWLEECRTTGRPAAQLAAQAAAWFEELVLGPQNRLPERWSPIERRAALAAARFRLEGSAADFRRAQWILSAALDGSSDAPPDWQATARALLVFSLAGQGRRSEAAAVLEQISAGPPQQLLAMLEGLSSMAAGAGADARAELAQLQLSAIPLLDPRRQALSPSEQQTLDRIRARALADAGRTAEALETYGWLSKAYPRDGDIQEGYARLLLTRPDRDSLESALTRWREVETHSRPGSERWFRAKFAVAFLHYRMQNSRQAEKILRLVAILHPEPKLRDRRVTARFVESLDPPMRAQFLELLDRSGR